MAKNNKKSIVPSLICTDLCNLERSVNNLKSVGFSMMHVDLLDGNFSPSMPIGLDTISQIRERTNCDFDVHLMTNNNDFFVDEMIRIGCERLCFHLENTDHVDFLINKIKQSGIKVGVALKPATNISVLEEFINEIDFVLLMLINPGYASFMGEGQVPYAENKIRRCKALVDTCDRPISIEVDGRIGLDNLEQLLDAGADYFVAGTTSIFKDREVVIENKERMEMIVNNWVDTHG